KAVLRGALLEVTVAGAKLVRTVPAVKTALKEGVQRAGMVSAALLRDPPRYPQQTGRVIAMFGSIGVLFLVPWLDTSRVRSARFRPVYRVFFWFLIAAWLVLAYCGSKPPEGAYVTVARVAAAYYFAHFLILLPFIGVLETPAPLPATIGLKSTRERT